VHADACALAAEAMAARNSQVHTSGRILAMHPWISTRNLDELCYRVFLLAR